MGTSVAKSSMKGILLGSAIDSLIDAETMLSALEPTPDALVTQAHDLITRALAMMRRSFDDGDHQRQRGQENQGSIV